MGWSDRDDRLAACEGPGGAVAPGDHIARLLTSNIDPETDPKADPFPESALGPPKGVCCTGICGVAEGLSVTRVRDRTDDDLRRLAAAVASARPGRTQLDITGAPVGIAATLRQIPAISARQGRGAMVADVNELRDIRLQVQPGQAVPPGQIVFVYDDATPSDPLHAVLRCHAALSRGQRGGLRKKLKDAFSLRRVSP